MRLGVISDTGPDGSDVAHRSVEFDVPRVVDSLHRRRHPNRAFVASVLERGSFVSDR